MMKYIGIDIGSTNIKSALFDPRGRRILDQRKTPFPERRESVDSHRFEISAEEIFVTVKNLIDSFILKSNGPYAVLLSTQMHGFVYKTHDREDMYVSWQDTCSLAPIFNGMSTMEYLQNKLPADVMESCGVYIKPSLGLCNLFARLKNDPDLPGNGELFTIGSYLIYRLTGKNICHMMNAAPLGIVNVPERKWRQDILKELEMDAITLPSLAQDDFSPVGFYRSGLEDVAIYPDYGDQQVSILGSMAGQNDAVINIATASQVSIVVDVFSPGAYETRPYFENRYINTISNMPSGRNLEVLIRFLQDAVLKITGQEVSQETVWQGIGDVPAQSHRGITIDMGFFSTPENLQGGVIQGIRPDNFTLSALFSAAYEDMAKTYLRNISILRGEHSLEEIVCAGGVSWKNTSLIEAIRRISGCLCRLSPVPDEALSGLFRISLVCERMCDHLSDHPEWILMM